jgi:cleavage and polyadenylation specificity factor subunit 2
MGRIAVTEDVEGIRDEEEVIDEPSESPSVDEENAKSGDEPLSAQDSRRKFIATVIEVQDAFDSCNTLRYSQPTHLQGKCMYIYLNALIPYVFR